MLFTKRYKNIYKYKEFYSIFKQEYTYGPDCAIKRDNTQDKYTYIKDNSVIYGINELIQKGRCDDLCGICFESTKVPIVELLPLGINDVAYPLLYNDNTKSAMIFQVSTENIFNHNLQIYKFSDEIKIIYYSIRFDYCKVERLNHYLPSLSDGNISSEEIQNVLSFLQEKLGKSIFMDIITNELNSFALKIDIRKGLVEEKVDPLDPKLLIDKPFDEICSLINANRDEYFRLISEQFKIAANIS